MRRWWPAAYGAAGVGVLALLLVWQGRSYVEYSDGVYAATAQALLHGAGLYRDVAAAQPPPLYFAGKGILAIHDSVLALRIGMSVVMLATGGLVAACVQRLTGRPWAAAAAGVVSLVMPWQLREHATLLPETLAGPPLMAAALAAAHSRRGAALAGALGAVAVALKLAFALPALAVALAARRRGTAVASLVLVAVVIALGALAAYGSDLWREVVRAQLQLGSNPLGSVVKLWAQAAWTAVPLLVLAAPALLARDRLRDPALVRTLVVLTLSALLLVVTVVKHGTFLSSLMLVEPPAVALAAAGLVTWWGRRQSRIAALVVAAAAALVAAQSISLLADPTRPRPFARPGSAQVFGWPARSAAVDRAVARARRCPPGVAYSGPPYLAFASRRRMPGDQADQFIIGAKTSARFARAAAADRHRCP